MVTRVRAMMPKPFVLNCVKRQLSFKFSPKEGSVNNIIWNPSYSSMSNYWSNNYFRNSTYVIVSFMLIFFITEQRWNCKPNIYCTLTVKNLSFKMLLQALNFNFLKIQFKGLIAYVLPVASPGLTRWKRSTLQMSVKVCCVCLHFCQMNITEPPGFSLQGFLYLFFPDVFKVVSCLPQLSSNCCCP